MSLEGNTSHCAGTAAKDTPISNGQLRDTVPESLAA